MRWRCSLTGRASDRPGFVGCKLAAVAAQLAPEPIPFTLFTAHPDRLPEPLATAAGDPRAFVGLIRLLHKRALAPDQRQQRSLSTAPESNFGAGILVPQICQPLGYEANKTPPMLLIGSCGVLSNSGPTAHGVPACPACPTAAHSVLTIIFTTAAVVRRPRLSPAVVAGTRTGLGDVMRAQERWH